MVGQPGPDQLGTWLQRVGATLLDGLVTGIPLAVSYALYIPSLAQGTPPDGVTGIIAGLLGLVSLGLGIWNVVIRQGSTGQTVGKQVLGLKLLRESDGQPVGAGVAFVRALAHVLDGMACYIGYLWPLWDQKRQTFADKIMSTLVVKV
ncbi:RDD family protein [Actinopolymorpha sp. B17G11]|uniref:RDD family protein n=1 Tax=unclassified Actinopolymorpha TaxID=2627063 RepID=UPI0032D92342